MRLAVSLAVTDDSQPQLCFPSCPAGRGKPPVTLLLGNWTQDCPGPLSGGGKPGLCPTHTTASARVLGQDVLVPKSPLCCLGWEMECLRTLCPEQRYGSAQNHTPTSRTRELSGSRRARAGGGGEWGGDTAGRHSLGESQTCCRSRLWRLLQKDSGASGRGPEPRGQKGRCHQFQFCPGRPEAAWDFPEWKDRLGGQATWRQGLGAMEVLGIQGGLGVPPWGPHSLPEPPVPHASQPQPRILATEEIIGLLVSSNEGCPRGI